MLSAAEAAATTLGTSPVIVRMCVYIKTATAQSPVKDTKKVNKNHRMTSDEITCVCSSQRKIEICDGQLLTEMTFSVVI